MAAPKAPFPVRLSDDLLAKLKAVAAKERRKTSEMARLLIEDGVAAYEQAHGPIVLPAPPVA